MARNFIWLRYMLMCALAFAVVSAFGADETGQPAPRFRARTTTGEQFNNESVKGKVVGGEHGLRRMLKRAGLESQE